LCIGLLAYGVFTVIGNQPLILIGLILSLFVTGLFSGLAIKSHGIHQQINFGPIMNINIKSKDISVSNSNGLDALIINQSYDIAQHFCQKSVVVNGPLAALLDVSGAIPLKIYCDNYKLILGGQALDGFQSELILSKYFWDKIDVNPEYWLSDSWGGISDFNHHHPSAGITPSTFNDYVHPPRSNHQLNDVKTETLVIDGSNHQHLLISNLLPFNVQYKVESIFVDHKMPELKVVNAANHLYYCSDCNFADVDWRINITSNDFNAIEINTF
jgi:hypothetical protein